MTNGRRIELGIEDTQAMLALGAALAEAVRPEIEAGFVVDLRGDLGMGKTVLVRGLARALGVPPSVRVTSPTFTVARAYDLALGDGTRAELQHVDAYRLEDAGEMDASGFEEMCGKRMLTCVEWAGRVASALPADRLEIHVTLAATGGTEVDVSEVPELPRAVVIHALGSRSERVLERLRAECVEVS